MTKFNVGDKVRVIEEFCEHQVGKVSVIDRYDPRCDVFTYGFENDGGWIGADYIELVTDATDRRLNETEAKIAALESKVAALETVLADKSKLTTGERLKAHTDANASDYYRRLRFPTPNQRRADVIKRAQAFVADTLAEVGEQHPTKRGANNVYNNWVSRTEFVVNAEKRTVVAIVRIKFGDRILTKAIAKCAPDDVFNADIGKAIALGRALGVKVPKEFTDAPKPTEVVVGTKIKYYGTRTGEFSFDIQTESESEARTNNADLNGADPNYFVKIVDDSDAVYL